MRGRTGSGAIRGAALALAALFAFAGPASAAPALASDAAIIAGFEAVVFSAEYRGLFSDTAYLKRFPGPVRFAVEPSSRLDRRAAVAGFVRQIGRQIEGLDAAMARAGEMPNFTVHVVDRAGYAEAGRRIYGNPTMPVPGNCIVRAVYTRAGITRADALIVSDEGDRLFRRCLIEEVLQGLGPLNDYSQAPESVFNDTSKVTSFTRYDRVILNMLYDKRLKPGMSRDEAAPLLPDVLRDAKRRTRH